MITSDASSAWLVSLIFDLCAFLIGSIPFGLLIARAFHVRDLTRQGSGNIGATNVSRVVGFWPAGFLTFVLDVAKGALPLLILAFTGLYASLLNRLGGASAGGNALAGTVPLPLWILWTAGLFTVLGHCFSPWLQFRGGKGVATGFGAFLVLSPLSALAGILGFAITFLNTRIGSLSSLVGLAMTVAAYLVLNPVGVHAWAGAAIVLVILVRHQGNIQALLKGREKSFR